MGLFASPNRAAIMNSLPPGQRGVGAGMSGAFQNSAIVLSMGIFFSLMISGISAVLPRSLYQGLVAHQVPVATASTVSHLPPITSLFASLLGYNPIKNLLPGSVLAALPAHSVAVLSGRSFFPELLSKPFADGLTIAFTFGAIACALAAVASLMRGGKYVHSTVAAPTDAATAGAISGPLADSIKNGHEASDRTASSDDRVAPTAMAPEVSGYRG
jgi:hypothetical protein